MTRPTLSLGDVLRAFGDLAPDHDAASEVLALLAYYTPLRPAATINPQFGLSRPPIATAPSVTRTDSQRAADAPAILLSSNDALVERLEPFPPQRPDWLATTVPLTRAIATPRREPPGLLDEARGRAILSAVCATRMPSEVVDVERVTRILAEGRSLATIPRIPLATLRRRLQILVDVGSGMDPFRADQRRIVRTLRRLVGGDRLVVMQFLGCPSRGVGNGEPETWAGWRSPGPGIPIIALTDAGIGFPRMDDDHASPEEWAAFGLAVRSSGNELVGLVPFGASRWPALLTRSMTLVPLSEKLTVSGARRAIRPMRQALQ